MGLGRHESAADPACHVVPRAARAQGRHGVRRGTYCPATDGIGLRASRKRWRSRPRARRSSRCPRRGTADRDPYQAAIERAPLTSRDRSRSPAFDVELGHVVREQVETYVADQVPSTISCGSCAITASPRFGRRCRGAGVDPFARRVPDRNQGNPAVVDQAGLDRSYLSAVLSASPVTPYE